jgi:hypothetical protein
MLFRQMTHGWLPAAVAATTLLCGATARAQATVEECTTLNLPHPVYGSGGSAITADLAKVATALAKLPEPITILFADPSACTGYQAFIDKKVTTAFKYWTADGTQKTCAPPITGQAADFAHMGNPVSDCQGATTPADVGDFGAPVQTLNIITGPQSDEQSISAEALYFIFGFGAEGEASPWVNNAHIVKRSPTSFVHLFLAAAIGVPAASFKGEVQVSTNPDSIAKVIEFSALNKSDGIGYVSGSAADAARGTIKTLAYQAKDQTCAYWPDSTASSADKANVRSGQYALWAPGHFYARIDSSTKEPVNEDVKNLIGWYDGTIKPPADIDVLGIAIDAGDIPACAMRVTRDGLAGAISSYAPPTPCTHYFEKRANGTTDGTTCDVDADCKSVKDNPKCQFGYCEAY